MKPFKYIIRTVAQCAIVCVLFAGCSNNSAKHASTESGTSGIGIEMRTDSITIAEADSVLPLPSYVVCAIDSLSNPQSPVAYCYNNRTNAIDVLDIAGGAFTATIPLHVEGPDGIPGRIRHISCINGDSLMVYDTVALYFLTKDGHVTSKYDVPKFSRCPVDRNARAAAIDLRYDPDTHIVTYPVVADDHHHIEIEQYNLLTGISESFTLPYTDAAADLPRTADWAAVMNSRKLYLTVFDSDFNTITEVQLPQNRYNPFFGWFNLPRSVAFFIDNGNEAATDATRLDIITLATTHK